MYMCDIVNLALKGEIYINAPSSVFPQKPSQNNNSNKDVKQLNYPNICLLLF